MAGAEELNPYAARHRKRCEALAARYARGPNPACSPSGGICTPPQGFGGWQYGVVVRTWVLAAFGMVPYLGSCVPRVDAAFFFNKDRRCLHHPLAGTIVVRA